MTATSLPAELSASLSALLCEIQNKPKDFMLRNLSDWGGWLEERGYSSSGLADFLLSNLKNQQESKINSALIVNVFADCRERSCSTGEFVQSLDRYDTGFIEDYIAALIPCLQSSADILKVAGGYNHPKAHAFEANHPGVDVAEGIVGGAVLGFFVYMCCKKYIRKEVGRGAQEELNRIADDPMIDNGIENSRELRNLEDAPVQNAERVAADPEAALTDSARYLRDLSSSEPDGLKPFAEAALKNQEGELYRYLRDKEYFKLDLYPDILAKDTEIRAMKADVFNTMEWADKQVNSGALDGGFSAIDKGQWRKFVTIQRTPGQPIKLEIQWSALDEKLNSLPQTNTLRKYLNNEDPDFLKNIEKYRATEAKINKLTDDNLTLLRSKGWDKLLASGTDAELDYVWSQLKIQQTVDNINDSVLVEGFENDLNRGLDNLVDKEIQAFVFDASDEIKFDKQVLKKFTKSLEIAVEEDFNAWADDVADHIETKIDSITT